MKKFELVLSDKKVVFGITLYRIKALIEIERFNVKPGDLGGFLEKKKT